MKTNEQTKINVLVVEDEADLRRLLAQTLEDLGYGVAQAVSGQEAFQVVESQPVQIIISDIRMANGSGLELLEKVLKSHPHLPVVLMTGYSDYSAAEIMQKGCQAVVHKPFKRALLLETLKKIENEILTQKATA